MKRSAGVLAYKKEKDQIKVLLAHMGGPYWSKKDIGAWSIPKGEYEEEEALAAAVREFQEETGLQVEKEQLTFLCSEKQSNQKLLTIFVVEKDFDLSSFQSNLFELEWPPKTGNIVTFPEMDRIEWLELGCAKEKILKGQQKVLEKLEKTIPLLY